MTFPVDNVWNKLNHACVTVNVDTVFEIDDAIVDVKRQVAEAVTNWNNRYVMCGLTEDHLTYLQFVHQHSVFIYFKDKYVTLLLKTGCRSNVSFHEQGFGILCRKHDGHLREAWMKRGLTVLQAFVKPCLALCQISGAE